MSLVLGVLVVHLAMLAGDALGWDTPASSSALVPDASAAAVVNLPAAEPARVFAATPSASLVRWIAAPAVASALPLPVSTPMPEKELKITEVPSKKQAATTQPVRGTMASSTEVQPEQVSAYAGAGGATEQPTLDLVNPSPSVTPLPEPATIEEVARPALESPATAMEPPAGELLALAPQPTANSAPRVGKAAKAMGAERLPPAKAPAAARLLYDIDGKVKGFNYSASATLDWEPSGTQYNLRTEVRVLLLGKRVQTSSGQLDALGLHPERFSDRVRSEKATHFDYALQRIRFSSNAPETALLAGAQDRLSVFLQLSALFNARPEAYAVGQAIQMQVAGTGDAEVWQFDVDAQETLALPAGSVRAWRLSRKPRKPYDSEVDIWLAPALNHLPVRIRITQDNGDVADQRLSQMP